MDTKAFVLMLQSPEADDEIVGVYTTQEKISAAIQNKISDLPWDMHVAEGTLTAGSPDVTYNCYNKENYEPLGWTDMDEPDVWFVVIPTVIDPIVI